MIEKWPLQAFILSKELLDSVSFDEVNATFEDMKALKIAKPPYDEFDLIVPVSHVVRLVDNEANFIGWAEDEPGVTLRIRYTKAVDPAVDVAMNFQWLYTRKNFSVDFYNFVTTELTRRGKMTPEMASYHGQVWRQGGEMAYKLLLVMLATRNVVKTVKENKLLKFGIGNKKKNRYTTTISIGRITEVSDPSKPTGTTRRPHLRRGHIRRQHYGPRNELVKEIFIEPVFVNADEGWIAERTAYNLIKEHKHDKKEEPATTLAVDRDTPQGQ